MDNDMSRTFLIHTSPIDPHTSFTVPATGASLFEVTAATELYTLPPLWPQPDNGHMIPFFGGSHGFSVPEDNHSRGPPDRSGYGPPPGPDLFCPGDPPPPAQHPRSHGTTLPNDPAGDPDGMTLNAMVGSSIHCETRQVTFPCSPG